MPKAKESGVERIVVCAPIKIGKNDYYMGVMLQRDARQQRLYLHNIVSVAIEREAPSFSKDDPEKIINDIFLGYYFYRIY